MSTGLRSNYNVMYESLFNRPIVRNCYVNALISDANLNESCSIKLD